MREPPRPFTSTSRWLRGRIVERLRAAPNGDWVAIAGPIGDHDQAAVDAALEALARDGLVVLETTNHTAPIGEASRGEPPGPDRSKPAPRRARLPT